MHLIVDAQALQATDVRRRGIGRYARELIRALGDSRKGWHIEAVVSSALPMPDAGALGPQVALRTFEPLLPVEPSTREANERYFGDWLSSLAADALIEPNFFEGDGLVPRFTGPRPFLAGVAYDLIPLLFHERYLRDPITRALYGARLRQLAGVDLILAISECTRADVIRLMRCPAARVVTIGGGADRSGGTVPTADDTVRTLARLHIDRPFVLCVGGVDRRKNLSGALAAYAALSSETRARLLLVVVCALTADQAADLDREAARLGVQNEVRLTGFVDDVELYGLYGACRLMLFPSYYEGLGLPVLEALQAGAPVVASNRSAIPEFAGPVSRLVDPASPAAMAAAIGAELEEPREAHADERRRFASRFRWSETARLAADAIDRGMASSTGRPRRTPRVAWVSPVPPTQSGISDYSAELLDRLTPDFDVELVVSPEATTLSGLAERFRVVRAAEVPERHAREPFDLFVYHVGNSDLHVYMLDLMREHSGLVVLHDVQLGGLALRARAVGRWPGDLPADIEREGAVELAAQLRRGEGDHERIDGGVSLWHNLVEANEGAIVHSAWSWRHVHAHVAVPVFRIAMGVPPVPEEAPAAARARLGLAPDLFVVVTLGEVTPAKQIDRLIRAGASLPDRIRARLRLIVAGPMSPACEAGLATLARQAGLAEHVRFEGRVPMERLTDLARAADACVQLRFPARGETSAALLRALAAGGACIVSEAGSFSELPPDVALRVTAQADDDRELAAALVRLHDESGLTERLRDRARRFAAASHDLDAAARNYAAAIHLTIARRERRDGEWIEGASAALAAVRGDLGVGEASLRRWADVRARRT